MGDGKPAIVVLGAGGHGKAVLVRELPQFGHRHHEIVDGVAVRRYRPNVERVFRFDDIVAAHRFMEENRGSGKIVVSVDS